MRFHPKRPSSIRSILVLTAIFAFVWSGWFQERHFRWGTDYKNVYGRGWAGGCYFLYVRGRDVYWHAYVDVIDTDQWKFQIAIGAKRP